MSQFSVSSSFFMLVILFFIQLHISIEAANDKFTACHKSYKCGNIYISYPFYDDHKRPEYCGYPGFKLNCSDVRPLFTMLYSQTYYLLDMDPNSHTISVGRDDFWTDLCPETLSNTALNFSLFNYTNADDNVTLYYECSKEPVSVEYKLFCPAINHKHPYGYFLTKELKSTLPYLPSDGCKSSIVVPIYESISKTIINTGKLQTAVREGFELKWLAENDICDDCRRSGGECGYNTDKKKFACYCPDGPSDSNCNGMCPCSLARSFGYVGS